MANTWDSMDSIVIFDSNRKVCLISFSRLRKYSDLAHRIHECAWNSLALRLFPATIVTSQRDRESKRVVRDVKKSLKDIII
jgi:hypothetical protein